MDCTTRTRGINHPIRATGTDDREEYALRLDTGLPSTSEPPVLLDDRYRLVEHIGAGRAGPIWSAVDLRLRRSVAVRLVPLSRDDAVAVLASTAAVWTPGLARVYDVGLIPRSGSYLVREFVPGASLDACVDAGGLPVATIAAVGACVASTLAGLHLQGLGHGGVHGRNIVLAVPPDERPDVHGSVATLTDLGLRTVLGGSRPRAADDVRGLGETLLGAVTARRVVGPRTTLAALRRLRREPALRPRERQAWTDVLAAMTAEDASERPSAASVAALLATLAREAAAFGSRGRARGVDRGVDRRARGVDDRPPPPWEAVFTL